MNQKDWNEKYYPIPAQELKNASWEECLDHSILKWSGNAPEILEKYKALGRKGGTSCALCAKSSNLQSIHQSCDFCSYCVLCKFLKGDCDGSSFGIEHMQAKLKESGLNPGRSPFRAALDSPQGMVNLLTACKSPLEKGEIE